MLPIVGHLNGYQRASKYCKYMKQNKDSLPMLLSGLKGTCSGLIGVVNICVEADTRRGLLIPWMLVRSFIIIRLHPKHKSITKSTNKQNYVTWVTIKLWPWAHIHCHNHYIQHYFNCHDATINWLTCTPAVTAACTTLTNSTTMYSDYHKLPVQLCSAAVLLVFDGATNNYYHHSTTNTLQLIPQLLLYSSHC